MDETEGRLAALEEEARQLRAQVDQVSGLLAFVGRQLIIADASIRPRPPGMPTRDGSADRR